MKIGVKFNQLTAREYLYILERHKKYTDFNPLALYRSIIENDRLDLTQKIAIRDLAHQQFFNFFEFLQIKDPFTYVAVSILGRTLTKVEESQLWENVEKNQEKILKAKRIKHRNFGIFSRSEQSDPSCAYNGTMIRRNGSNNPHLTGFPRLYLASDKRPWNAPWKSADRRAAEKRAFRDNKMSLEDELIDD